MSRFALLILALTSFGQLSAAVILKTSNASVNYPVKGCEERDKKLYVVPCNSNEECPVPYEPSSDYQCLPKDACTSKASNDSSVKVINSEIEFERYKAFLGRDNGKNGKVNEPIPSVILWNNAIDRSFPKKASGYRFSAIKNDDKNSFVGESYYTPIALYPEGADKDAAIAKVEGMDAVFDGILKTTLPGCPKFLEQTLAPEITPTVPSAPAFSAPAPKEKK